MNTNKALPILLAVLILLLARQAVCAPQDSAKAVQLSHAQVARLETNIAHAIIWQLYWCQGKTSAQLRKQIAESRPTPYTLCRGENDEPCVYLDGYQWKVVLTEIGGEHYGFDVEDYMALARDDAAEAKSIYLEALQHETILAKGTLTLRPEHLTVLAFDKPGDPRYKLITNLVTTNLLSSQWLKKDMASNKVRGPLAVHIGGFTGQSPWVYYHIEGMPYVGTMLINPSSGEFIHDEFLYIHENPRESVFKNMQRAIDRSGTKLLVSVSR
jgi:hypothetical protein